MLTLLVLDVYQEDFEKTFLEATKQTYRTKSQLWIASDSTPEYLAKVCQTCDSIISYCATKRTL